MRQYLRIILEHWIPLVLVTLVACGAAVGLSFIPTRYYSSEIQLLIVQKQNDYVDTYTSQKAAEKIGTNLVKVVGTSDFMNRVITTGYISSNLFSTGTEEQRKQWANLVESEMVPETSVLHITGYGTEPGKAEDVALGVMQVLTTNASDYHGAGDAVQIKQIDGPVTSTSPVKPNIILNGAVAAVLGWIVTYTFILLRAELRTNRSTADMQYEVPKTGLASGRSETMSLPQVEYKVLDEYPARPYVYGAELKDAAPDRSGASSEVVGNVDGDSVDTNNVDAEPVSIHDHLRS